MAPGESRSFLAGSWYAHDLDPKLDYLPELQVTAVLGPDKAPQLAWSLSEFDAERLEWLHEDIREAETQLQKVATYRETQGEVLVDRND